MEFIRFVFADLWHFVGTVVLIAVVFDGVAKVIRAMSGRG